MSSFCSNSRHLAWRSWVFR